jgi:MFS superfamily sulfate permease-like transporter
MNFHARVRFVLETATAVLGSGLAALTLLWPDWIERVFGVDPDGGSGLDEWLIVAAAFSVAVASALLARREWRARSLLESQRG